MGGVECGRRGVRPFGSAVDAHFFAVRKLRFDFVVHGQEVPLAGGIHAEGVTICYWTTGCEQQDALEFGFKQSAESLDDTARWRCVQRRVKHPQPLQERDGCVGGGVGQRLQDGVAHGVLQRFAAAEEERKLSGKFCQNCNTQRMTCRVER